MIYWKIPKNIVTDTEKTLQELDHVIGYYNVADQVKSVVKERPSSIGVPQYLQAMDRLAETCVYFEQNQLQSVEIENVVKYLLQELTCSCIVYELWFVGRTLVSTSLPKL